MKKSKKRQGELVSLTEALSNLLMKSAERKEQLAKSSRVCIQKREEARRAQDASREAKNEFKRDIEKFMDSDAAGDMRSKEVAEKVWKANQSGCKKAQNLDKDLLNILLPALKKCRWEKDLDESTKIRAKRR